MYFSTISLTPFSPLRLSRDKRRCETFLCDSTSRVMALDSPSLKNPHSKSTLCRTLRTVRHHHLLSIPNTISFYWLQIGFSPLSCRTRLGLDNMGWSCQVSNLLRMSVHKDRHMIAFSQKFSCHPFFFQPLLCKLQGFSLL